MAFIITSSAFAVGLGNIWRFPYITGEGGGGAFLLVYLILIILIGIPVMTIEITLGRMAQKTPLIGYGELTTHKSWNLIGWLGVVANILIMSYYVMIMAWITAYFWEFLSGKIFHSASSGIAMHFSNITSNYILILILILAILSAAFLILRQSLQSGLERYSKILMIGLIILLISLTIWSATLDGAAEGYKWFLYPDFSKITITVIISALGQLFFSIGVGMAVAFVFGSYISTNQNLIRSTTYIVLADTFFAILAGLLLFPIIFSYDLRPDSGPNLVFITMSSIFMEIDNGWLLGALFFSLLFMAGFTSLISSIQAIQNSLADRFDISELQSLLCSILIIFSISIPVVLSFSEFSFTIFELNFFELLDYLTNNIMLPVGGLLIVLFAGHKVGYERLKIEHNGHSYIHPIWRPIIKYFIPIAILIILINGIR